MATWIKQNGNSFGVQNYSRFGNKSQVITRSGVIVISTCIPSLANPMDERCRVKESITSYVEEGQL